MSRALPLLSATLRFASRLPELHASGREKGTSKGLLETHRFDQLLGYRHMYTNMFSSSACCVELDSQKPSLKSAPLTFGKQPMCFASARTLPLQESGRAEKGTCERLQSKHGWRHRPRTWDKNTLKYYECSPCPWLKLYQTLWQRWKLQLLGLIKRGAKMNSWIAALGILLQFSFSSGIQILKTCNLLPLESCDNEL